MKLKELDLLITEFEEMASHRQQLCQDLRSMFTTRSEETIEEIEISFTELRALCANKSRDGHTQTIRDMILDTGAKKLSEVEPSKYTELYRRVEALR